MGLFRGVMLSKSGQSLCAAFVYWALLNSGIFRRVRVKSDKVGGPVVATVWPRYHTRWLCGIGHLWCYCRAKEELRVMRGRVKLAVGQTVELKIKW